MENDSLAPKRFRNIGFAASWAALITIACILVGQSAQQYAMNMAPMNRPQLASTQKAPQFNAIDYGATGAIKSQSVALSPCGPEKASP